MMPIDVTHASDAELVSRFAVGRDQRAFAELVRRHGSMVMGVAVRMLRDRHDAEDAFQATFLALARAAGSLRRHAAVAAWLHRTVIRSVRSIQRMNARWKRHIDDRSREAEEACVARPRHDVREVLDAELARLPEKFRAAIVLCDLEGMTRAKAAECLGLSPSTLANHVADGRKLLRTRLAKRGIGLSAAGLVTHLADLSAATPPLSAAVINATTTKAVHFAAGKTAGEAGLTTTVVHLTQGVLRAMTLTKLGMIAAAALAIVFSAGSVGGVANVLSSAAKAETILIDDFNDGDADGWIEYDRWGTPGVFDASSGAYQLIGMQRSPGRPSAMRSGWDNSNDARFSNGVLRATVHASSDDTFLGFGMRVSGTSPPSSGYLFGAAVGHPFTIYEFDAAGATVISRAAAGEHFSGGVDWIFETATIGDEISFKYWPVGESEPATPQLTIQNARFSSGRFGVHANVSGDLTRPGSLNATFDDIYFTPIPEPTTATLTAILFAGVFAWQWRRS